MGGGLFARIRTDLPTHSSALSWAISAHFSHFWTRNLWFWVRSKHKLFVFFWFFESLMFMLCLMFMFYVSCWTFYVLCLFYVLCFMIPVLYFMFYALCLFLCIMFYVIHFMFYVLCLMFYDCNSWWKCSKFFKKKVWINV